MIGLSLCSRPRFSDQIIDAAFSREVARSSAEGGSMPFASFRQFETALTGSVDGKQSLTQLLTKLQQALIVREDRAFGSRKVLSEMNEAEGGSASSTADPKRLSVQKFSTFGKQVDDALSSTAFSNCGVFDADALDRLLHNLNVHLTPAEKAALKDEILVSKKALKAAMAVAPNVISPTLATNPLYDKRELLFKIRAML